MLNMNNKIIVPALSLFALGSLALSGCAPSDNAAETSSAAASVSTSASNEKSDLEFTQTWVKAGQGEMTAAFGDVTNHSDKAIKLVSAESSVSEMTQLHTTEIDSKTGTTTMKQVDSMTIEPGETFKLEPGGNHIMLMDMKCSIPAGHTVKITLKDDQGKSYVFEGQARDYSGAKEEYAPGEQASSSASMDSQMNMGHSMHGSSESASAMPACS